MEKKETYLLFDFEGNIRIYSLTEKEVDLIEDILDWISLPDAHFEKLTNMSTYKREEN